MSKIKTLKINNFIGVSELGMNPGKITLISGPKGSGKSSILEAIQKGFTNGCPRSEVISHNSDESTLYIELDDGLSIDRRIRENKGDYLKVRKEDSESVPSTEKFLRSLINGSIFKPIEFINMSVKEQTKSILSTLQIDWDMKDILNWFKEETCGIDYERHVLQVLKSIETKYFNDREEINREIKYLKAQVEVILKEMPADYDGEVWKIKKVQEYYNKVSEGQKVNAWIANANSLKDSIQEQKATIEADTENKKARVQMKYKDQAQDIKDIVEHSKGKIEKSNNEINNLGATYKAEIQQIESINKESISKSENDLQNKISILKNEYDEKVSIINKVMVSDKEKSKLKIESTKESAKDLINIQENKISSKNQELISLDEIEKQELINLDNKKEAAIEKVELKVGKANEYLKNNEVIDVAPLQIEADEVAEMQSYLRQWDMMLDIRDVQMVGKCEYSSLLTTKIETARTMPVELLKTAKMPVEGISVDEKGLIRINNTLIDGLSDGEKLELAMEIAKVQCGELKCICVDRWESINKLSQEILFKSMEEDDFQYFITEVADEFKIEKRGSIISDIENVTLDDMKSAEKKSGEDNIEEKENEEIAW